ncbi:MAG: GNAT family N-acetyltransferase [Candidatus Paceibacterota bacterium]|jgi:hypothetical protein
MLRKALISDIEQIIKLEKKYYDRYSISEELLSRWINNDNFFVIDDNSKIIGSIYFEFLDEIEALPWYHEPINSLGDYAYISEIAVDSKDAMSLLFGKVLETSREKHCKAIIWLTGEKSNHDKLEKAFLSTNNFAIFKKVDNWECAPNYFIHDHSLWINKLN